MKATIYNLEMDITEEWQLGYTVGEFDPLVTPYKVDERDFPRAGSPEDQFRFLIRYAILAPSGYNTQPWKFAINREGIAVYADYTRRLPVADPGSRELLMSVGCAIMNLRVAAAHFAFDCRVDYNYSGDSERPLAFLGLSPRQSEIPQYDVFTRIFPAITKRRTNRNSFLVTRIPDSVLQTLRSLEEGSQISVFISTEGTANQQVAELVALADRQQRSDVSFRHELAEWTRTNWTRRSDGMPGAAFGAKGISAALTPWATKVIDLGKIRAANDRNLCALAPGLVVIYSEDSVPHWIEAGELLERFLLTIIKEGLQYSFFNMPIEIPELRTTLRGLLGLSAWPQLLLRIGFCLTEAAATPRRPIEDVIVHSDIF
jgi:hypothetical protein